MLKKQQKITKINQKNTILMSEKNSVAIINLLLKELLFLKMI